MSKLPFTTADLAENFTAAVLERGKNYQRQGKVLQLSIHSGGTHIDSKVQGEHKKPYAVKIQVSHDTDGLWVDGTCTCPVGFNCKHVTATLWAALEKSETTAPVQDTSFSTELHNWLGHLDNALQPPADVYPPNTKERIIYVLSQEQVDNRLLLRVEPCVVRVLKNGAYSQPRPLPVQSLSVQDYVLSIDQQILHWLEFAAQQSDVVAGEQHFPLVSSNGVELLEQLLATERCHWGAPKNLPLHLGPLRKAHLEWVMESNGLQQLHCRVDGEAYTVMALAPPWYVDHKKHECGPLDTGLAPAVASALLAAPPLKPEQIRHIYSALTKRLTAVSAPLPKTFTHERELVVQPVPCLRLFNSNLQLRPTLQSNWRSFELKLPLAELSFLYGQSRVLDEALDNTVSYVEGSELFHMPRQYEAERAAQEQLKTLNLTPLKDAHYLNLTDTVHRSCWIITSDNDAQRALNFSADQLPQLRKAGWHIEFDASYPYRVVEEESADWYSEIRESAGNDWFSFELGISVNGVQINLLPPLLQMIGRWKGGWSSATIAAIPEKTKLMAQLPDGRFLPIPVERVRTILSVLTELYDSEQLTQVDKLKLSRLRIAHLLELEAAMGAARFRWIGGEKLRKLGEKLRNFTGIQTVEPPAGFQAELRPYQQEGLNWLQFLREYDLAGILADDMGLGKTVQALAHLLVEKNAGRMDKPSLVVAPTSLMANWRLEAKRFAPQLKVLTLHGAERRPHFNTIRDFDLVLTTYPLLVRDKEALIAENYHLLILDEAQVIKNPKAKATQIVHQITARHRLCLTGTPMENHLGELWSLFHFLLPGLLGEHRQFHRLFRTPIEKFNDNDRRASLVARISPFMLRRTKQEVVQELPPKTEILRTVELEDLQRDLYESIRIAMHEKVNQAIQDKGLARSQIVILDALLKLRQVCCDPRLLKLTTVKKQEVGSAKLDLLMDMLPNLVEEGRRILLFSQFTSMLELIEQELAKYSLPYLKLTGQTQDRSTMIERFQSNEVPLFLISLKAGGTGLNLTAADTVIHYDPWWNPAVEHQATDRAHRIGQDKAVFVYKLVTAGTVEEKILSLQDKKQALMDSLFSSEEGAKSGLAADDLLELFQPLN